MKLTKASELADTLARIKERALASKYSQYSEDINLAFADVSKLQDLVGKERVLQKIDLKRESLKNSSDFEMTCICGFNIMYDTENFHCICKHAFTGIKVSEDIMLYWNANSKTIGLCDGHDWNFYRDNLPYHWSAENPEPNKVGVLTNKKVGDWLKYLASKKVAAEKEYDSKVYRYNKFMDKIRAISPKYSIKYEVGDKCGVIEKNGLRLAYSAGIGYNSVQVTLVAIDSDELLETFRRLTD